MLSENRIDLSVISKDIQTKKVQKNKMCVASRFHACATFLQPRDEIKMSPKIEIVSVSIVSFMNKYGQSKRLISSKSIADIRPLVTESIIIIIPASNRERERERERETYCCSDHNYSLGKVYE